ncbi:MAG: glycine cleavage system protein H, partial [Gammaproteobacteria bacterium]|nr:glycine cleavage system protein H [Gammaproteobacteria bacterium]
DEFATVESVKAAAESYLPASGTLLENNELLEDAPETINSDPYGDAWMIKVEFSDVAELDDLLDAAAYGKFLEERDN